MVTTQAEKTHTSASPLQNKLSPIQCRTSKIAETGNDWLCVVVHLDQSECFSAPDLFHPLWTSSPLRCIQQSHSFEIHSHAKYEQIAPDDYVCRWLSIAWPPEHWNRWALSFSLLAAFVDHMIQSMKLDRTGFRVLFWAVALTLYGISLNRWTLFFFQFEDHMRLMI